MDSDSPDLLASFQQQVAALGKELPDLLASFQQEVAALGKTVSETKARLARLGGSATSKDGSVTVTVSATGTLQRVAFGGPADDLPVHTLAPIIMSTARTAHAKVTAQMLTAVTPLLGPDSPALHRIREFQETGESAHEEPVEDEDIETDQPW
ncbi:MAG TPA: YbaB/EbfC family nucleoid-associated protein [Amycolatopsis sp.]|nr:YbaB/EbfC family nucleoid-associated protein [Amycolatopsis sp.]